MPSNTENVECRSWLWFYCRQHRRANRVLHVTALQNAGIDPDNLKKGDRLTFDVENMRDGKTKAGKVHRIG